MYIFCESFDDAFVSLEARGSKNSNLLQVTDLIIGAIGFEKNGLSRNPKTRSSKKELAIYIAEKANLANLSDSTSWKAYKFTIWNFKLKK
jgi:hypothetical protein